MKNDFPYIYLDEQQITDMAGIIKPTINAKGWTTALQEYKEKAIIEEIAANSYDAFANNILLLLDEQQNKLYFFDDGIGFNETAFSEILTLGGGNKIFIADSKRPYLGSYGLGLKAVVNIANKLKIETCSSEDDKRYFVDIDLLSIPGKIQEGGHFAFQDAPKPTPHSKGTIITLNIQGGIGKAELDAFGVSLGNLPSDNGNFNCYFGFYEKAKNEIAPFIQNFTGLDEIVKKLYQEEKIKKPSNLVDSELTECEEVDIEDKEADIQGTIFYAGLQNNKTKPLKQSLRGIYIRVNGRLLKNDFSNDKYISKISKYIQFKSGMRTELSVDWLRRDITLARDGVKFSNEKLEEIFYKGVSRIISKFIKPRLDKIEKFKQKAGNKRFEQRIELANKRKSNKAEVVIKGIKSGFIFKPDTDAELAILVSQDHIMNQINPDYKLIDYNDKEPFDCMIYDTSRDEFIYTELEPTLMDFLQHTSKKNIRLVIVWNLGKWRLGAGHPGKGGYFKLIQDKNALKGHYKVLEYATDASKEHRAAYEIISVEEILVGEARKFPSKEKDSSIEDSVQLDMTYEEAMKKTLNTPLPTKSGKKKKAI